MGLAGDESSEAVASPFVAELGRLLDLRASFLRSSRVPPASISDGDLMVIAFVATELGIRQLLIDDSQLLEALRAVRLHDYAMDRTGQPLEVRARDGSSDPGEDVAAGRGLAAACMDARHAARHRPQTTARAQLVFLYGLRGGVQVADLASAASVLHGHSSLLPLAGVDASLWSCTAAVLVPDSLLEPARTAIGKLSSIVKDRSMDPLVLAQTCTDLRLELKSRGGDRFADLQTRTAELEEEVWRLKAHLMKQQRALAALNEGRPVR